MNPFLEQYAVELLLALTSIIGVGAALFRAQANEREANAKAVSELALSSADLRERIDLLEAALRAKDEALSELQSRVLRIPTLEMQLEQLQSDYRALQQACDENRQTLTTELNNRQQAIDRLREQLKAS